MSDRPTITKLKHAQELFLLLIVEQELTTTEAYAKAYPRCKKANRVSAANRLLRNVPVQTRKAELEREKALVARAASHITAEFITKELLGVAKAAAADKQHSAAAAALMGVAKIHGMLVEKHVLDMIVRKPSLQPDGPDEMTEAQWLQEYGPLTIEVLPEDEHK